METPQFTYLQVHLYYTLPVTFVLWCISRPFHTRRLWVQVFSLVAIALVYTTPWDNYLVWTGTWFYPDEAVLGTIGYVPLEEYFFFIIQSVMVVLWTFLCLRWSVPYFNFLEPREGRAKAIRWAPIPPLLAMAGISWMIASPKTELFYMCCIMGWAFPVVALLWYGVGNYVIKNYKAVIVAVLTPTIYLVWVDLVALRRNVWSISPEATIGVFVYDALPFEEAFFFFIVNVVLVLGYSAFDKAFNVLDTYPDLFTQESNMITKFWKAFAILESKLPQEKIKDIQQTFEVLKRASKSFWAAGFLFPPDVRHDLSVLYAFCRVTDDMVDNAASHYERNKKLDVILKFLDQLFADRSQKSKSWIYGIGKQELTRMTSDIDWQYFEKVLSTEEIASFRSLTTISFYLPPEPFYELCRGYKWDLTGKAVLTESDLVEYSQLVASSVAILCTSVLFFKSGRTPNGLNAADHRILIDLARDMGVSLQLTNIARDIVTDSETLGRCYVPQEYIEGDCELMTLIKDKAVHKVENTALREFARKILELAKKYHNRARAGFDQLPEETLRPIICATDIYAEIGRVIGKEGKYPKRASVGDWAKAGIVCKCMYFPLFMVKRGACWKC